MNTINISRSIRRYKKISIFENLLVVESFFLSNYRLTAQNSDYILKWRQQECFLGNFLLGLLRSRRPKPSSFESFIQKIPVLEFFFRSNYRLAVQSSDYLLKWLHQECFLGNPAKDIGAPKCYSLDCKYLR